MLRTLCLALMLAAMKPTLAAARPYEGLWSSSAAGCSDRDGPNDTVHIRGDRYDGYELHCRIRNADRSGDGWRLRMTCEAEGERLRASARITMVQSGVLTVEQRLEGISAPTRSQLVRCKAAR